VADEELAEADREGLEFVDRIEHLSSYKVNPTRPRLKSDLSLAPHRY
jgi:hypothetical protein